MRPDRVRPPTVRRIPASKREGFRLLTLLDSATDARYVSLVAAATPAIEARLRPAVVANRVRRASVRPPRLGLEPTVEARDRFDAAARELCRAPFVAVADVENCYPSISPGALIAALDRTGVASGTTRGLIRLLDELAPFGIRGLPVGPVPSAVLANAVLAAIDDDLALAARRFVRWVDDVWIAAASRADAEDVIGRIGMALHGLGLRLSERKTRIVAGADVAPNGVSAVGPEYHRPAHAHPLPGVARPDAIAPRGG